MTDKGKTLSATALAQTRYEARLARRPRSFLSITELTSAELQHLIQSGLSIKHYPGDYARALEGTSLALLFQKTSTRTRSSFEAGVRKMGGEVSYIEWSRSNFVLAELSDEVAVFSRFYGFIVARVYKHETVAEMAKHSEVPVINGLCDLYHPCQAVSDLLTMTEYFGDDLKGLRVTYIGDGNNVCRSLLHVAHLKGVEVTLSCPSGFTLDRETISQVGSTVKEMSDPMEAAKGAHVIYTDTWVSMGQEEEMAARVAAFKGFEVNDAIMAQADKDAIFMHCLPAHPGQEVSAKVLRGSRSVVIDQAENRMHAQNALLIWLREQKTAQI